MALVVSADAFLLTTYKTWYTEKRFPNLLFRNSPVLRKIQKNRIGGRNYNIAMMYGRGGAVSGDYTIAVAAAGAQSRSAEMAVTPGNVFSVFTITQKEILAAQEKKGAYVKSLINRMFAATEGSRKMLAACLYGHGYGDVGQVTTAGVAGAFTLTLTYDVIVKLDVGSVFSVTTTGLPNGAFHASGLHTITAIDGNVITFTVAIDGAGWAVGQWIEINGGRDAGTLQSMPVGLAAWLPSIANRTGGVWAAYIAAAFFGTVRNVSTNALAGWFYQRVPGELRCDAITQGIKLARRGGGIPDMIVMNDEDWQDVVYELNAQTTMWQGVNVSQGGKDKNAATRGISDMAYAFSSNWIKLVYDDPYCPRGTCYILDSEVIEFAALSNVEPLVSDGITENNPGAATVESVKEPSTDFSLMIDDYLNVTGNSTSIHGPAAQVSLSLYGNFVCHEPGHCAVVVF